MKLPPPFGRTMPPVLRQPSRVKLIWLGSAAAPAGAAEATRAAGIRPMTRAGTAQSAVRRRAPDWACRGVKRVRSDVIVQPPQRRGHRERLDGADFLRIKATRTPDRRVVRCHRSGVPASAPCRPETCMNALPYRDKGG